MRHRPLKISEEERHYWSSLWYTALFSMPTTKASDMGWTTLAHLLGYKIKDPSGKNCAAQHLHSAATRGYKPRLERQQRLLRILAGPHGITIARAILIKKGINPSVYKHWPNKKGKAA